MPLRFLGHAVGRLKKQAGSMCSFLKVLIGHIETKENNCVKSLN